MSNRVFWCHFSSAHRALTWKYRINEIAKCGQWFTHMWHAYCTLFQPKPFKINIWNVPLVATALKQNKERILKENTDLPTKNDWMSAVEAVLQSEIHCYNGFFLVKFANVAYILDGTAGCFHDDNPEDDEVMAMFICSFKPTELWYYTVACYRKVE